MRTKREWVILDRVIQIRRQDGLPQEAVVKRMGMSQSVVARIELGLLSGCLPSLASLQNMRMRLVVNNSKFVLFKTKNLRSLSTTETLNWLRGQDLNLRPSGYEPDELPDCSTPRSSNEDRHYMTSFMPLSSFLGIAFKEVRGL